MPQNTVPQDEWSQYAVKDAPPEDEWAQYAVTTDKKKVSTQNSPLSTKELSAVSKQQQPSSNGSTTPTPSDLLLSNSSSQNNLVPDINNDKTYGDIPKDAPLTLPTKEQEKNIIIDYNRNNFITPEKFPKKSSEALQGIQRLHDTIDLMPNPYGIVGKLADKAFLNSSLMAVQGAEEMGKAGDETFGVNEEPSSAVTAPLRMVAGAVKTAFGVGGTVMPQLGAFNTAIEGLGEIVPEQYIGAVMSPMSTLLHDKVIKFGDKIYRFDSKGGKATTELLDLTYQILLFKGLHKLAGKVKSNSPINADERTQIAQAVDEGIKDYSQPFKTETLDKIPTDISDTQKAEVAPLIEKKEELKQQVEELQKSKQGVDDSFHPSIDEKIKSEQEKINDANEEIKFVLDSKHKTEPIDLPVEPEIKPNETKVTTKENPQAESEVKTNIGQGENKSNGDIVGAGKEKDLTSDVSNTSNVGEGSVGVGGDVGDAKEKYIYDFLEEDLGFKFDESESEGGELKYTKDGVTVIINPSKLHQREGDFPRVHRLQKGEKAFTLDGIAVDESARGKGSASQVIDKINQFADESGTTIYLKPSNTLAEKLGIKKGLTNDQLKEWYARHGFEKQSPAVMVRKPKAVEQSLKETTKAGSGGVVKFELPTKRDETNNFPLLKNEDRVVNYIPKSVAEKAYKNDAANNGKYGAKIQSLDEISRRGGYNAREMDTLYPEWRKEVAELNKTIAEPKAGSGGVGGDVETTAKALEDFKNKGGDTSDEFQMLADFAPDDSFGIVDGKDTGKKITDVISELYHKDKAAGKETNLTKAVEQSLKDTSNVGGEGKSVLQDEYGNDVYWHGSDKDIKGQPKVGRSDSIIKTKMGGIPFKDLWDAFYVTKEKGWAEFFSPKRKEVHGVQLKKNANILDLTDVAAESTHLKNKAFLGGQNIKSDFPFQKDFDVYAFDWINKQREKNGKQSLTKEEFKSKDLENSFRPTHKNWFLDDLGSQAFVDYAKEKGYDAVKFGREIAILNTNVAKFVAKEKSLKETTQAETKETKSKEVSKVSEQGGEVKTENNIPKDVSIEGKVEGNKIPDIINQDALDNVINGGGNVTLEKIRKPDKKRYGGKKYESSIDHDNATIYAAVKGLIDKNSQSIKGNADAYSILNNDKGGIKDMIDEGSLEKYIDNRIITPNEAKKIIELAGLEVPKDITEKTKSENKGKVEEVVSGDKVEALPNVEEKKYRITDEKRKYKDNENADWVRVSHADKNGNTFIVGSAIDKYGSREKAIEAAKENIDRQIEKATKEITNQNKTKNEKESKNSTPEAKEEVGNEVDKGVKEVAPESKTARQIASEARKAAKEKLDAAYKNLGVIDDPKQKAKLLFDYHKALVNEAKEYIKEGIKTASEFAKEIGEKISESITRAWDEAIGKHELTIDDFKDVVDETNPKEIKIAADDKSMLKRLIESDNVSDKAKQIFKDNGLKYEPHTHEEARELAKSVVDEFGEDAAIIHAETGRLSGDIASAIFAESIDRMAQKEIDATDPKQKIRWAKKWADYAMRYDEAARSKGRFISQIYDFYKKSPLGIVLKAEKEFAKRADEIIEPRKKEVKEALNDLLGTPEFEAFVKEKVADAIVSRKGTRKAKVDRFFDKLKINTKGTMSASIVPPQIWNGAVEVMRKAAHAGLSVAEIVERGVAHINANHKEGWKEDEFRNEYQKKLADLEKDTRFNLTEEQKKNILEKWRTKLKGLNENERKILLQRSLDEIVNNGALEFNDFKKMYADALGLPKMTDELRGKIMDFGKQIQDAEKAGLDMQKERTDESVKRFDEAMRKSEEASRQINDLLGGEKHPLNTMLTMMRLNTLTPISLVANPIYNLSVLPLRGLTGLSAAGIDPLLAMIPKLRETGERRSIAGLKQYAQGGRVGAIKSVRQFFTGLSDKDYFQKEIKQNIKPFQSMRNIRDWVKGEKKSTIKQKINDVLEASPLGIISEIHARGLNIGDKAFRYAAEYQMAEQIAIEKGLTGIDKEIFKRLPDETSKQRIIDAGEKAIFSQDNFISNLQKQYEQAKEKTTEKNPSLKPIFNFAEIAATATQPFLKIPLNAAIFSFEMSMPELMLVKGLYDAGVRGDRKAATTALAKAATGFAIRYVATQLAQNGIITADEDRNRERRGISQYLAPYSMNFSAFRRWVTGGNPSPPGKDIQINLNYFGSLGNLLGQAAEREQDRKYAEQQNKTWNYLDDLGSRFSYTIQNGFEQGVFRGTSSLLQGIYNGSWDSYLTSAVNVAENTVAPSEIKLLSQLGRDTKPDFGAMDTWDKLGAQAKLRFFGGKNIPADVNMWGEDMKAVPEGRSKFAYYFFDVTKYSTVDNKQFGVELRDLYTQTADPKVFPDEPKSSITVSGEKINFTPTQYHDFKKIIGQERKQLTDALFQSSNYISEADVDKKIEMLNSQYTVGYNEGKKLFQLKYPSIFPKPSSTSNKPKKQRKQKTN